MSVRRLVIDTFRPALLAFACVPDPTRLYRSRVEATYHRTRNVTTAKIAARVWKLYHLMISELETRGRARACAR